VEQERAKQTEICTEWKTDIGNNKLEKNKNKNVKNKIKILNKKISSTNVLDFFI
jgi:hypothetical protein